MTNILIIDDDQELRGTIAEVLSQAEFAPLQASDGESALRLLQEQPCDLVLLDLVMPGMKGMEVLHHIRRIAPGTPVILMTAFATVENAVEAMHSGAVDYLTKPFKIDTLLATVRKALEEARFAACRAVLDMDNTFSCLANPIRREALILLRQNPRLRFMDLTRRLGIEDHTKVNFHLKVMREAGLIEQGEGRSYQLTPEGARLTECLQYMARSLEGF